MAIFIKKPRHLLTRLLPWLLFSAFIGALPFIVGIVGSYLTTLITGKPCGNEGQCPWDGFMWLSMFTIPIGVVLTSILQFIVTIDIIIYIYKKVTNLKNVTVINRTLEKYKLTKTFETEFNVEKEVFINEFKRMTEKGYYTPFLIMFDIFKPKNKKYIGDIDSENMKIRRRFTLDNFFANNFATVKSEFKVENSKLKVRTIIQGMEVIPFVLRVILFAIYLLLMLLILIEILTPPIPFIDMADLLAPVFITIFAVLFIYLPYRIAKRNVTNKKNDIDIIYQLIEKKLYNNGTIKNSQCQ